MYLNPAPAGAQICSQPDIKQEGNPVWVGLCLFVLFHKPNFISLGDKSRWHEFSCSRISPSKSKVTDVVEILTANVNSAVLAHRMSFSIIGPQIIGIFYFPIQVIMLQK